MKVQKKKERKPMEVERVEKEKVEKVLNKRKIREVKKYLVQWKGFMAEGDIWEKKENLKNTKELIKKFEREGGVEIRWQEGSKKKKEVEEYKRMELPGKYMAKLLYRWNDRKFEKEYLKKLKKNWRRWKNN